MTEQKLKPCPFCGGKPDFIKRITLDYFTGKDEKRWSYKCRKCHVWLAFNYATRYEAVKAWNRRTK